MKRTEQKLPTDQRLINLAKSRILELQAELKMTTRLDEICSLNKAIADNASWLMALGVAVNISQQVEVA